MSHNEFNTSSPSTGATPFPSGRASYFLMCLVTLGTAVAVVQYATSADGVTRVSPTFLSSPTVQARPVRLAELSYTRHSGAQAPAMSPALVGPTRIAVAEDGTLLVIDDGDAERIHEFLSDGLYAGEITANLPSKTIASVTDLRAFPDRFVVADLIGKTIHTFWRDAERWQSLRTTNEPYRLEPTRDRTDRFVIMRVGAPQLFDIVDERGAVMRSFGDILTDQPRMSLALDGFMARTREHVVFAGKYLGVLAAYTDSGQRVWMTATATAAAPPTMRFDGNSVWVEHGPLTASDALAATETSVIVLARRISGTQVRSFIDLYHATDGTYYQSLRLPDTQHWTSVAADGTHVYVAGDRGVVRWPHDVLAAFPTPLNTLLSAGHPMVTFSRRQGDSR